MKRSLVLKSKNDFRDLKFLIRREIIRRYETIRYFGKTLGDRVHFREYIKATTTKTETRIAALAKIMPNIGGPGSLKRRVITK